MDVDSSQNEMSHDHAPSQHQQQQHTWAPSDPYHESSSTPSSNPTATPSTSLGYPTQFLRHSSSSSRLDEERYNTLSQPRRFDSPHGGYDLPSLNAALGGVVGVHRGTPGMGGSGSGLIRADRSDISASGSTGAEETGSRGSASPSYPRMVGDGNVASPSLRLPPPSSGFAFHGQGAHHLHSNLSTHSSLASQASHSHGSAPPHSPPPPPIPTTVELERHYNELRAERRRLEDMMVMTDKMIAGVKRGLDEMRVSGGDSSLDAAEGAPAVALRVPQREERMSRGGVWAYDSSGSVNTHSS